MEQVEFELELLEEARDFLKSLTKEVRRIMTISPEGLRSLRSRTKPKEKE